MRSSDFTTCDDGATLATMNSTSAPACLRRVSCGTTSTSASWNFSMPAYGHVLLGERGLEAGLVRFAPGIVDQDHAGLLGGVFLDRVVDQRLVDQHVDRGDAEHVVLRRAVAGDRRAGRPDAHERHLALVGERHDRHRHRRVEAAEQRRDLFALHQFARRDHALGRIALVVAHEQLDLLAEQAALGVDLVDRDARGRGRWPRRTWRTGRTWRRPAQA